VDVRDNIVEADELVEPSEAGISEGRRSKTYWQYPPVLWLIWEPERSSARQLSTGIMKVLNEGCAWMTVVKMRAGKDGVVDRPASRITS